MKKFSTAKGLEALSLPPGKDRMEASDTKSPLRIRIGKRTSTWIWTVQDPGGKRKTVTVGQYPVMSLKDAREEVDRLKAERADQGGVLSGDTVGSVILEYLQIESADDIDGACQSDHLSQLRAPAKVANSLLKDVLPRIGQVKARELQPRHIVKMVEDIKIKRKGRGGQEPARIALLYANQVFMWAVARQKMGRNPAADVDAKVMGVKRTEVAPEDERVLSREEIASFLALLDAKDCPLDRRTILAFKILLHTGVRGRELLTGTFDELHFMRGLWMVPGGHTKLGRPITYKLPTTVTAMFQELRRLSDDPKDPKAPILGLDRRSLGRAMTRLQTPRKDGTVLWNIDSLATPHCLRKTFSTHANSLSLANEDDVERQLGHAVGSSMKRKYDRAARLKERGELLEKWAVCLENPVQTLLPQEELLAGLKKVGDEDAAQKVG